MRIRNLLLACIGIVGFVAVLGAGSHAIDGFSDSRRLDSAIETATGLRLSMILSERISAERSKVGSLLSVAQPGQAEALTALDVARVDVEQALHDLMPYAGGMSTPLAQSMTKLREAHDRAVRLPGIVVDPASLRSDRQFVLAAAATQNVIDQLVEEQERALSRLAPQYGQFVALASQSQALREIAGLRSALLSPELARGRLSSAELREMDELSGQVRSAWIHVQLNITQIPMPPADMLTAYQVMSSTIMGEGDQRYRTLITELGEGQTPSMTIAQYRAWTSPMLANALLLRNTVFAELASRFAQEHRRKAWQAGLGLLGTALAVSVAAGALWLVMHRVASPLARLTRIVAQVADGKLDVEIAGYNGGDELSSLADAVLVLRDRAVEARRLRSAVEADEAAKLRAAALLRSAALTFEHASASGLVLVVRGETTLKEAVHSLDVASRQTVDQARAAAADVAEAATQVEVLTGAVAVVEVTVADVSLCMSKAATAVTGAEGGAQAALIHIVDLSGVANRISGVVHVIRDIAERTKLLALNASIEASRVGAVGRGFAVVAAEVKSLAVQTEHATREVATHIREIQHATDQAGQVIRALSGQVSSVAQAAGSVVSAIEQQRVATDDIAAAARTASVGVLNAATQVELAAQRTQEAQVLALMLPTLADDIKNATGSLRNEIDCFVTTVREAA